MVHFRELQGNRESCAQFTSDPQVLFHIVLPLSKAVLAGPVDPVASFVSLTELRGGERGQGGASEQQKTHVRNRRVGDERIAAEQARPTKPQRDRDLVRAEQALGRPYSASGVVQRGAERGRELGFRTLNVSAPASEIVKV
mgnify:CR=1 FL=1